MCGLSGLSVRFKGVCARMFAGSNRDVRDSKGDGWERERGSGCETNTASEIQSEESCGGGFEPDTLHTDSQLETLTEASAASAMHRGCGDSASHTQDSQVEEGGHCSGQSSGLPGADAHAGDRGWKRLRTSTSRVDAGTLT